MPAGTIQSCRGCALMAPRHNPVHCWSHCKSTVHTWLVSLSWITTDNHGKDRIHIGIAMMLAKARHMDILPPSPPTFEGLKNFNPLWGVVQERQDQQSLFQIYLWILTVYGLYSLLIPIVPGPLILDLPGTKSAQCGPPWN